MTNKDTIRLTESQKRIIQLMQDHGYDLVFDKEYFFWRFEKNGRDVMKHISSLTARALVSRANILQIKENLPNKNIVYELTAFSKTINIEGGK